MSNLTNYANLLNDIFQRLHRTEDLKYEQVAEGPQHNQTHKATCLIRGEVYGQGTGPSKQRAKEAAAKEAYEMWMREHPQ